MLTMTSLDVTYCKFANAYKSKTPIKMDTLPLVWADRWS